MARTLIGFLILVTLGASADAGEFVTAGSGSFWLHGHTLRFVGYNVRGIAHYGEGDLLPYSNTSHRNQALQFVHQTGGRVIRIFVAARTAGRVETGNRLEAVLDIAHDYGVRILVCLTDYYYDSNMYPQGDESYYQPDAMGWTVLSPSWFAGGFRVNYLPQATYLATRFRDRPEIFGWEVGNEVKNPPNREAFVSCLSEIADAIRAVDPNHMISTGTAGRNFAGLTWDQAVRLYNHMDFVGTHNYHGSDSENDVSLANSLGQPLLIGEAGFDGSDRPARTDADISKWIGRGADGYLQWGLMASTYDIGDGDRVVGMDPVFHANDWFDYVALYTRWADTLSGPWPTPTPPPGTPMMFLMR